MGFYLGCEPYFIFPLSLDSGITLEVVFRLFHKSRSLRSCFSLLFHLLQKESKCLVLHMIFPSSLFMFPKETSCTWYRIDSSFYLVSGLTWQSLVCLICAQYFLKFFYLFLVQVAGLLILLRHHF
jgi:hypothetical protein